LSVTDAYSSSRPTLETRKTVTVLFADVVAFSDLAERLDPEALRAVMATLFQRAEAEITRYGGTVEKFVGDEVVAVFGVPAVREDDALRAVNAAVALRECVAKLESELGSEARLQVRVGVNTGEVIAGDPSSGQAFVTGDAVAVGKRLEQAAGPGEILLGPETHVLVAHAVEATPLGPLVLKGNHADVPRFRLESVDPEAPAIPRRQDAPLVGREHELEQLRGVYADVAAGNGSRFVLLLANAGIGKSRLARELIAAAQTTTLVGRCPPFGEGITFSPLRDVFLQVGRDEGELEGASYEVFAAARRLLEELAVEKPVLLVLDDVHWAEETFLDLIEHLYARLGGSPVLLLCLARLEIAERRPGWLRDAAAALTLEPLSEVESHRLLDALGAPRPAHHRIAAVAEGNPLFMEQFAAIGDGIGEGVIASSIRGLLHARLDRLERPEVAVLERAAVVGRSFSLAAVLELTAPAEREHAQAHLFELARKGFVRPDVTLPEEGFRFQHALIRDVVYDSTPKGVRAQLHERMAERLEGDGAPVAIVGYHLEQAFVLRRALAKIDPALGTRAGQLLRAAAQESFGRADIPAAISLLDRARALLPATHPELPTLLTELGYARINVGDMSGARAVLDDAIEVATTIGDRAGELHARIERQFVRTFTADSASADDNVRVAVEALPELEQLGDEVAMARAWWLMSSGDVLTGRMGSRTRALEAALAHARRAPNGLDLVGTISGLLAQALYYGTAPVADAIARIEQLAVEAGSNRAFHAALGTSLAGLKAMQGSIAEARGIYAEAATTYEEFGLRFRRAHQGLIGAQIELFAGDPEVAERELRVSAGALAEYGASSSAATHRAFLAEVLCVRGQPDEAEELARDVAAVAPGDDVVPHVLWRAALSRVLAQRGAVAEAATLSAEAVRLTAGIEFPYLRVSALTASAEVEAALGDRAEARRQLEAALDVWESKGNAAACERLAPLVERSG
jgi:class 3 adenylate cyclase/tetratricopeptide (TPR) repeat protein